MNVSKTFIVFSIGLFSMVAQAIVFREFIASFDSGVISVALFFFSWLFWTSISSFTVINIAFLRSSIRKIAPLCFIAYIPAFILQFFLFFKFRDIIGLKQYQELNSIETLFFVLILNSPISILTSIFFQSASDWIAEDRNKPTSVTHRAEAAGAFIGGFASTILFYLGINSCTLAIIASLPISIACPFALKSRARFIALIIPALLLFTVISGYEIKISEHIARKKWGRIVPEENYIKSFRTEQAEYSFGNYHGQII
ncbi:MAG TPA: hypothetical protein PK821_05050, partial [Victivallales bacterium]|nr:hypothetical protein [Victivallales bacterium]